MKKFATLLLLVFAGFGAKAQLVSDSVITGAGYANQVWYSLKDGQKGSSPKNSWDIAFEINGIATAIFLNTANGDEAWTYPNGDTSAWNNVDTAGILGWTKMYNSDETWDMGAFNVNYDPSSQFDLGWGNYNLSTHTIVGDSLFVVKLADGSYRKLWLQKLAAGDYTFKYAMLDGSNEQQKTLSKTSYQGKNFGYYSLQNNVAADREPLAAQWDLLFGQYTTFVPTPYPVSGVLLNKSVEAIKAYPVNDVLTFESYNNNDFDGTINLIGYDWKTFNMSTFKYDIADSLVFFVKDRFDDVWKVVFTGFASSNGKFVFAKKNLSGSNGINTPEDKSFFTLYPNPSTPGNVSLVMNVEQANAAQVSIADISGRTVKTEKINTESGLNTYAIDTDGLNSGLYIVNIVMGNSTSTQKLVIR